jgi:SAM-dependent methyltransferase
MSKFDSYAKDYRRTIDASIALSGESSSYFHEYKLKCLTREAFKASSTVLDFGCGIGQLSGLLADHYEEVIGFDPSGVSIEIARQNQPKVFFVNNLSELAASSFDLIVCAGVFHHIEPASRENAVKELASLLRPGGSAVVFEHNPFNPLTRQAVDRCPLDDDAILLTPREVRRLFVGHGFRDVYQRYIVFFPGILSWLRPLEPQLGWLPFGAQTMTVAVSDKA